MSLKYSIPRLQGKRRPRELRRRASVELRTVLLMWDWVTGIRIRLSFGIRLSGSGAASEHDSLGFGAYRQAWLEACVFFFYVESRRNVQVCQKESFLRLQFDQSVIRFP